MPTIEPANTQQVIQMGSHVERLQQSIQLQSTVTAQQLDQERIIATELKNAEIQDPEYSNEPNPANPDGRGLRGRLRTRGKKQVKPMTPETPQEQPPQFIERGLGAKINIVV